MTKGKKVNAIFMREHRRLYVTIYDVNDDNFKNDYDDYRKIYYKYNLLRVCDLEIDEVESMKNFFYANREASTKYKFLSDFFYVRIFDKISREKGLGPLKI